MSYTQQQLREIFRKLPEDVREAATALDFTNALDAIEKQFHLHVDQGIELANETFLVMLGLTHPSKFIGNIGRRLKVPSETAKKIGEEVNKTIFHPIRMSLMRIHKMADAKSAALSSSGDEDPVEVASYDTDEEEWQAIAKKQNFPTEIPEEALHPTPPTHTTAREIVIDAYRLKLGGFVLAAVVVWAVWYAFQTEVMRESFPLISGKVYVPIDNLFWATAIVGAIIGWTLLATGSLSKNEDSVLLVPWVVSLLIALVVVLWNVVWWFLRLPWNGKFPGIKPDWLQERLQGLFEPGFHCLNNPFECDRGKIWEALPDGTQLELWHVWLATIAVAALVALLLQWGRKDPTLALWAFLIPILALYKIIWRAWELGVC